MRHGLRATIWRRQPMQRWGTVGGKVPSLKQRTSGFAANGGAATLAVQKVADALKVTWPPSALWVAWTGC